MPADLRSRRRPLLGLAAVVTAAALAVTGCSAGQQAQTADQTSVVDGVAFQAGSIDLRDVGLLPPSGNSYAADASASLEGQLVNNGADDDTLVSISSSAATQVEFYSDGVTALLATAPTPSTSATGSASASATGTPTDGSTPNDGSTPTDGATSTDGATASGSATPSDTGTPAESTTPSGTPTSSVAAAPSPETGLKVPAGESVRFGYTNQDFAIVFVGLTRALFPAESVQVTFTFASGATATATISVKLPVDRTLDAPTVDTQEQEGDGE